METSLGGWDLGVLDAGSLLELGETDTFIWTLEARDERCMDEERVKGMGTWLLCIAGSPPIPYPVSAALTSAEWHCIAEATCTIFS